MWHLKHHQSLRKEMNSSEWENICKLIVNYHEKNINFIDLCCLEFDFIYSHNCHFVLSFEKHSEW
jgi:hypothetical protein